MTILLAEGLEMPSEAVTQVFALLGRRGSGKTYAAGRLIEQLRDDGAQVVILDPVGTWYGLRLAADGVSPGLDIPVLGGSHGDLPLDEIAGKVIAQMVAERGVSLVLDVSEFTGAEQRRFVADFAVELLAAKKKQRSALMLVMEEAQEFAPQMVRPDHARMVGAIEKLVKLGRNFGVGVAMISQRPQAVNKDILNQAEVLLAFQLTGPQERKAVEGWVQEHGQDREIVGELPGLPIGTAIVWSPSWLKVFGRFAILPKRTFDASATPSGDAAVLSTLPGLDLDELRTALTDVVERAKADDPVELTKRLRTMTIERDRLSRQAEEFKVLASRATAAAAVSTTIAKLPPQIVEKRVEVPVLSDEERGILQSARDLVAEANARLLGIADALNRIEAKVAQAAIYEMPAAMAVNASPSRPAAPRRVPHVTPPSDGRPLGKAERMVLSVLAQYPQGRTKTQVAVITGYAGSGGGFNNAVSALRSRGFIEGGKDSLNITDAGLDSGIEWEPLPTGRALVDYWIGQLPKAAAVVLRILADSYPAAMSKAEVALRANYEASGGGFNNALSRLRTLELITRGDPMKASDDLGLLA